MRPFFRGAALAAAAGSLFALAPNARADEAPLGPRGYAAAESRAGATLLGLGALSVGGGVGAYEAATPFARGLSFPLLVGGGVEGILGTAALLRSSEMREASSTALVGEELRLVRLRANLDVAQALELSGVVAGGFLAYFGGARPELRGVGTGLAAESGLLLVSSVFAQRRADRFAVALRQIHVGVSASPSGGMLSISGPLR